MEKRFQDLYMNTVDDPSIFEQFSRQSSTQLDEFKATDVVSYDFAIEPTHITIVGRLDSKSTGMLKMFQEKLEAEDPNQFYYPISLYHLTILGRIPEEYDQTRLAAVLQSVLTVPMQFELLGAATNQYSCSVSAYPQNFSIFSLRQAIRSQLSIHGDDYTTHLSSYEYMGWVNLSRYCHPPKAAYIQMLKNNRHTNFGPLSISTVEVYRHQKRILDPAYSTCIQTIHL